MFDKEKVIKGLECAVGIKGVKDCNNCPYVYDFDCLDCDIVMQDALTLLQEQKHAKWILDRLHHYKCSACGTQWGRALNMNYCPTCGRYMEGRDPDDWRYAQDTELPMEDI